MLLLQTDVLSTIRAINKGTTKDNHVHITQVEDTSAKAKKAEKETGTFNKKMVIVENQTSPSSSKSPCPGGSPSDLPPLI